MEGELWKEVYRWVQAVGKNYPKYRVQHGHDLIALVWLWAALHDRPICWACQQKSWP